MKLLSLILFHSLASYANASSSGISLRGTTNQEEKVELDNKDILFFQRGCIFRCYQEFEPLSAELNSCASQCIPNV